MLLLCLLVRVRCVVLLSTYRDLKDELLSAIVGLEGIENRGELVGIEFYCV
jgi:hypothetical protein